LDMFFLGYVSGVPMNSACSLAPALISGYYGICGCIGLLLLLALH